MSVTSWGKGGCKCCMWRRCCFAKNCPKCVPQTTDKKDITNRLCYARKEGETCPVARCGKLRARFFRGQEGGLVLRRLRA